MCGVKHDIHRLDKRIKWAVERVDKDKDVLPGNRKTILKFDNYLLSIGIKAARRYKYLNLLRWLSKALGKSFEKATKEDFIRIVADIEKTKLSEWSKVDRKVTIKRFYKWFRGDDEEYPKEVRWMKCHIKNDRCRLPEELLTQEDVTKLALAAKTPRDKALVLCLFESGCRISELVTLQIKNIEFDDYGAALRVTGKTGDRRVRIVASAPTLAEWLNYHPFREDPQSYVFLRDLRRGIQDNLPFSYNNARIIIRKMAKKAGITKPVNPHTFRHSRATAMASKLTEAQMKVYFGWVQGSGMAGVYVHLSGRDVDQAILDMHGHQKQEDNRSEDLKQMICMRCRAENSPASKFCTSCGTALSSEIAMESGNRLQRSDDLINTLMKDPRFQEMILKKLTERGTDEVMEVIQ
ncbi:MAG: site-specific integrase [Candidatus Micrarchaeota archaeon]